MASSKFATLIPKAAPRPWPTCKLDVGLAETNSTWIFWPLNCLLKPKRSCNLKISSNTANLASVFKKTLIKPGPAISTWRIFWFSGKALTIFSASWRGLAFAALVAVRAILLAKSPWLVSLVRVIWLLFCQSAGSSPFVFRTSMALSNSEASVSIWACDIGL